MSNKWGTDKKKGRIFLGRDKATYGERGTGYEFYDPDFECGGPEGTPGRQCAFQTRDDHTQGLPLTGSQGRSLHIQIASYRDPLCPKTLFNIFTKSASPDKIQVRILQQNYPDTDVDCLEEYCKLMSNNNSTNSGNNTSTLGQNVGGKNENGLSCPYEDQIFVHKIDASEAAGPTWARALLSKDLEDAYKRKLVKTQDHCMSIDSHMDFENEFDHKMVNMWDAAQNEYAVLSTYVADIAQLGVNLNGAHEVPHLCMITYTPNVRTHATKCAQNLSKPKLTNAVWGAGLSFSKCHAELKVMVDPHTPFIFDGEEFNRAARFFTYGYDIYTPNRVYVLHDYHGSQSNPIVHTWHQNKQLVNAREKKNVEQESNRRLATMIDQPQGEKDPILSKRMKQSKFGLGDRRSLDQLIQFSGFDLRNSKLSIDGNNRCGNIQWVPFVEHPKGVNYIPRFDGVSEDPLDPYDIGSVWYDAKSKVNDKENPLQMIDSKEAVNDFQNFNLSAQHKELEKQLSDVIEDGDNSIDHDVFNNKMMMKHKELEELLDGDSKNENPVDKDGVNKEISIKHNDIIKRDQNKNHGAPVRHRKVNILGDDMDDDKDMNLHQAHERDVNHIIRNIQHKVPEGAILGKHENKYNRNQHVLPPDLNIGNGMLRGGDEKVKNPRKGFLVNHAVIKSPDDHGIQSLPVLIQVSVVSMMVFILIAIAYGALTGRSFIIRRTSSRKRTQ